MNTKTYEYSDSDLQDLVEAADTGGRKPSNKYISWLILAIALSWSLFQLWTAQFQYILQKFASIEIISSNYLRIVHLAFALALAFLSYPATKRSPRKTIPLYDWLFAFVSVGAVLYTAFIFSTSTDPQITGSVQTYQLVIGTIGSLLLLEAARRSLGPVLPILGILFLLYAYFGHLGFFDIAGMQISQKSPERIITQMWFSQEGIFGTPIMVSAVTVFLFVLFGALLEKAGAGNYFIQMAFGGLGHMRGGPAKAAIVSSATTGLVSGSSIANVVTTGTFTIPLMKRVGLSSEAAGAIEVASSVNGQIMPPVMGAAAFLMVEYIGIPYTQVVKHAFIPAIISYIALVYIVHLESLKNNFPALPKPGNKSTSAIRTISSFLLGFIMFGLLIYVLQYPAQWINTLFGRAGIWVTGLIIFAVYIALLYKSALHPDLELDDPNEKVIALPIVKDIYITGLYFLLPIIVLMYLLMIEQLSANLSAFWAVIMLIVMMITQRVVKGFVRKTGSVGVNLRLGLLDTLDGLIIGGKNMTGVAIATATAGMIVGILTLTDLGGKLGGFVNYLAGDNLILLLFLVGMFSLILGMGLPTTANYIVVSSIMVSVIVSLAASNGLVIPLVAAHLFVFYFGIMADVTPPVGLASFAAAAISGGDPIKTGIKAFFYSLRTVLLPFLFIFNTDLILYNVDLGTVLGLGKAAWIFIAATFAMLVFAAATQGYLLARNKWYETILLLLATLIIFRPGLIQDYITPPFQSVDVTTYETELGALEKGEALRLTLTGASFLDQDKDVTASVSILSTSGDSISQAKTEGYGFKNEDGKIYLTPPVFGSKASQKLDTVFDFISKRTPVELIALEKNTDRISKWFFIFPGLLLVGFVALLQRRRQTVAAF